MKRRFLTLLLLCVVVIVCACPVRRGVYKTLLLSDGSTVRAELQGDEYTHFFASADGRCFVPASGGATYHEVPLATLQEQALAQRTQTLNRSSARRASQQRTTLGGTHDPYVGTKKCLVVLVNFADKKFLAENDLNYYQDLINTPNFIDSYGNTHSVRDYYLAQSYGELTIDFDVAGPIELDHDYAYYGQNDNNGTDKYAYVMVQEACRGAHNQGFNFADYDWDGDGEVDQVFVLYAGNNEASDYNDSDLIWPHMAYLDNYGAALTFDGVLVNVYACSSELIYNNSNIETGNGIGAMCHEFSHCMGLPDAYDTGYNGNYGMNTWSIMDQGLYLGDGCGYLPSGYTAYERMYCGWLNPIELTEETTITGMKGLCDGGEAYIAYNNGYSNEYYLFENRTASGFDGALYGTGMLVTHLDYSSSLWRQNIVNTTSGTGLYYNSHERYSVVAADNSYRNTVSDIAADLYPTDSNTHLDNYSIPAAETFNITRDGTYLMNISLTEITRGDDGSIGFTFYPAGSNPNHGNRPEGALFYESFDYCMGSGGNDGLWGTGAGTGTFTPDNGGWTGASLHGANYCAMFGSNSQRGYVVTPSLSLSEECTLTFRAAPFAAAIPGVLTLIVETGDISLATTEIELPQEQWTDVSIAITGTGSASIRFRENSGINRFFLDEVALVPTAIAGIETITPAAGSTTAVYTLDGIYRGATTDGLTKGIYIVNGKKYIVR